MNMDELKFRMEKFNKEVEKIPGLKELAQTTNLPAGIFIVIGVALGVILVAFGVSFSSVIVQFIGVVYPIYKSIQALETESTVEDDRQWLTYWFIFSLFQLAESLFGWLLAYIPLFFLIKLLFIIWLQNPLTLGAHVIYEKMLKKYLTKYNKEINDFAELLEGLYGGESQEGEGDGSQDKEEPVESDKQEGKKDQ